MAANRVRVLRRSLGLSQRDLAAKAKTSQQQIARIETGTQQAGFDLALRLCAALGHPMEEVFPRSRRVLSALKRKGREAMVEEALDGGPISDELAEAGIQLDPRTWLLQVRLRGGGVAVLPIAAHEMRRIRSALLETDADPFVVFDSAGTRVALNKRHALYVHFLFEVALAKEPTLEISGKGEADGQTPLDPARQVVVVLADESGPRGFGVEEDRWDEDGIGEVGNMFFEAEHGDGEEPRWLHFTDEDGEEVFLRAADVALLTAPLWVIDPSVFEATCAQDGESSEEAVSSG